MPCQGTCVAVLPAVSDYRHVAFVGDLHVTKGHAMNIREMTEPECRAMLARRNVTRLACARNNQPYIVPIRVDLEGDYLYGYATLGQKSNGCARIRWSASRVRNSTQTGNGPASSCSGTMKNFPTRRRYAGLRGLAERLFQSHPMWWEPAAVPLAAREQRPRIVFRIRLAA